MRARLLFKDSDFDYRTVRRAMEASEIKDRGWRRYDDPYFDPHTNLPWNADALISDLALEPLLKAMSGDDYCIYETSKRAILSGVKGDIETIDYRQQVLDDCLKNQSVIQDMYKLCIDALEKKRGHYISDYTRDHPDSFLRESLDIINELLGSLRKLNEIAHSQVDKFNSRGWQMFFTMLITDLDKAYLDEVSHHLEQLKHRNENMLLSAELGQANKGRNYLLHEPPDRDTSIWARSKAIFTHKGPVYYFKLHPRDDAGHQALADLRDRGIGSVAIAVGQSGDNIANFFDMLQVELAFYVGCLNLHKKLSGKKEPLCLPKALPNDVSTMSFKGLYDPSLSLSIKNRAVGNNEEIENKSLVIITGTNTGGKSTFLRSVGIAQLMMQAGMFVAAESFSSSISNGVFTHYKREEDTEMESGKFDEELSRMSDIVDHIKPGALILFNESFAATNEREGSEIARQIITALLGKKIRVFCVTHLYELAYGFYKSSKNKALFLQAEHKPDGSRTFKMVQGEPIPTSYGDELYRSIFSSSKK